MFISQLVLYFVDYLLVLLNTMCIYPCFLQYNILYVVIPPPTYIRVSKQNHATGNFSKCYRMCANGVVTPLR
jgi:hypothetical protein